MNMKNRSLPILVLLVLLAFPNLASANAGTPLMWAGVMHLVFGNAVIGIGEGLLIALLFDVSKIKTVLTMIAANYFSAWIGLFFLERYGSSLPIDLNNGRWWLCSLILASYCMTLVLEWPCVALCFDWKQEKWFRRSVKATLVSQTASYFLLFGWYGLAGDASLFTEMKIVAPNELSLPESVVVYYIDSKDGDVYMRKLTGGETEKVATLGVDGEGDRLFARLSEKNDGTWNISALIVGKGSRDNKIIDVVTGAKVVATADRAVMQGKPPSETWMNFVGETKLGEASKSPWRADIGFWAGEGVVLSNGATGEKVHFAFETPFGAWEVRNAVLLPTDKLLFQLGHDQICVLDPATRRVALLWRGRGPAAVIEKSGQ